MDNVSKKTLAIIVTYNRLALLKECIYSLMKSVIPCDILIVNNNSTDKTSEFLDSISKEKNEGGVKFYIHNLDTNLNGAGGYNYGLREAIKLNYDYFWLMDDDTIVRDNSLFELYKVAAELKDNFGFLSSKVLWTDGTPCLTNIQRVKVARRIHDFTSHIVKVDFASFVSCFIKKSDVLNVGFPIKEFVIWTDDLEYTRRFTYKKLYDGAMPGYLCNDSIVTHKCASNFGVSIVKDTDDRFPRYKYIYRNDVYCFRREGIRGHIYMFIRNIYHIIRVLFFAKTKKLERVKVLVNGYIEGFSFNPK